MPPTNVCEALAKVLMDNSAHGYTPSVGNIYCSHNWNLCVINERIYVFSFLQEVRKREKQWPNTCRGMECIMTLKWVMFWLFSEIINIQFIYSTGYCSHTWYFACTRDVFQCLGIEKRQYSHTSSRFLIVFNAVSLDESRSTFLWSMRKCSIVVFVLNQMFNNFSLRI
jgi:hypothetical protein